MEIISRKGKAVKYGVSKISVSEWVNFKKLSVPISSRLCKRVWWNNKCYKRNEDNNGCVPQIPYPNGKPEIPGDRSFFKHSTARFSLSGNKVAYFSNDYTTNCCEVVSDLRYATGLTWIKINQYFSIGSPAERKIYWYPLCVRLQKGTIILDLTDRSLSFLETVARLGGWNSKEQLLEEVILNKDKSAYKETQEISIAVHGQGFQAICYPSARLPIDVNLPERNLVVFDEQCIIRGSC
jgi:hypothetical protein